MNDLNTIHYCAVQDRTNNYYCIDFVMMAGSVRVVSWYDNKGVSELAEIEIGGISDKT